MSRIKQTSVITLAMFTHPMRPLLWKRGTMSYCIRCGKKTLWELLIKTNASQRRRCLLRAKRHYQGVMLRDYEVAIPWKDDDTPLCSNRKTAEDRLISWETPSAKAGGCWEILPGDRSQGIKEWIQGLHPNCIQLVPTSFSCSERRQRDYESEDSLLFSNHIRRNEP